MFRELLLRAKLVRYHFTMQNEHLELINQIPLEQMSKQQPIQPILPSQESLSPKLPENSSDSSGVSPLKGEGVLDQSPPLECQVPSPLLPSSPIHDDKSNDGKAEANNENIGSPQEAKRGILRLSTMVCFSVLEEL